MLLEANGIRVRVEIEGPADGVPVLLLHALGTRLEVWKDQLDMLTTSYRVIRMDLRGHGESDAPDEPYSLPLLAGDVAAVINELSLDRVVLVGLSIGGMVAQTLALARPDLLRAIVLVSTISGFTDEQRDAWMTRIGMIEANGVTSQVVPALERWFTGSYRAAHPAVMAEISGMIRATRPEGFIGCCGAIRDLNLTDRLEAIHLPSLVVTGCEDPGTPPEAGRVIAERIPNAQFELIENAAHLLQIEQAEAFNNLLAAFLSKVTA